MNRCIPLLSRALLAAALALPALAQSADDAYQRHFPEHARRGVLRVVDPPELLLDGRPELLSPGSRIRGTDNLIVPSNQLVGRELQVNYTREATGMLHEVWILTPQELARQRRRD